MLKDRVAVITGAGTGIGREVALLFGRNRAKVVVNYRSSEQKAFQVRDEIIEMGSEAIAVQGDISKIEDCRKIIDTAVDSFGRIDILINNSGAGLIKESILDITEEEYERVMKTNVDGTYHMTVFALKEMEKNPEGGSIVSISSSAVAQPSSGNAVYAMSKTAIELLMRSIAQNHGVNGIRCNIVAPGPTETDMVNDYFDEAKRKRVTGEIPLRRFGNPK